MNVTAAAQVISTNPSVVQVVTSSTGKQLKLVSPGTASVYAVYDTLSPDCQWEQGLIVGLLDGSSGPSCAQVGSMADSFISPGQNVTVQPKVTVTGADICTDSITTRLEPSGVSGAFTLTLVSSAGSVTLVNQQMRAGGSYTDSFNVPTLPNRTFTSIQASWTVNGQTGTGSRSYSITVLGDYRNTCYITALETEYSGATVVAGTTTGPSQCPWSSREFIAGFLDAVNRNGSGIDSSGAGIQPESICTNPPPTSPAYNGRRYRRPTSIRTSCGNSPTVGVTVAASSLRCGTRVFINGIGCRIVQDTGNLAPNQLDHYLGTGNALCSRWPNPTAKVVRIN
jgi:3D (Asp-Asp-Asp) domain-containing protein